jgi:hypothetical protein
MGRFPHFCSDFALGTTSACSLLAVSESILRLAADVIIDLYNLSYMYFKETYTLLCKIGCHGNKI